MPEQRKLRAYLAVVAGFVVASGAARASAEQQEGGDQSLLFGDRITVRLVEVEVRVADEQGRPVTGLTRKDFEVYEDGRRVEITNFREIDRSRQERVADQPTTPSQDEARGDGLDLPAADEDRFFLTIFVDNVHIRPAHRERVFRQLEEYVVERWGGRDRIMVVSYDRSLHIEQPFTADAAAVLESLKELRARPARGIERDSAWRSAIQEIEDFISTPSGGGNCGAFVERMRQIAIQYGLEERNEAEGAVRAFGEFLNSLGGIPGRKAVLYVSDGIPLRPGEDLLLMVQEKCEADRFEISGNTMSLDAGQLSLANPLERLYGVANRNRITLYTLDASGLGGYVSRSVEFRNPPFSTRIDTVRQANLQDPLHAMAAATGGRAILDRNDIREPLERLLGDFDHYYSLAYAPGREGDSKAHQIEVKLKTKQGRLRYRKSHQDRSVWERLADRTLATLWYDVEHNPLEVSVELGTPRPSGEGTRLLPVLLEVPLGRLSLLPHRGGGYVGQLSIFLASQDDKGRKAPPRHLPVPVHVTEETYLRSGLESFTYRLEVTLRTGAHDLAISVIDELSGVGSYLLRQVQVGEPPRQGGSSGLQEPDTRVATDSANP